MYVAFQSSLISQDEPDAGKAATPADHWEQAVNAAKLSRGQVWKASVTLEGQVLHIQLLCAVVGLHECAGVGCVQVMQ